MNGDSKAQDKATNQTGQTNGFGGCLSALWLPILSLWDSWHKSLDSSGASEIIRLLSSLPPFIAFWFLLIALFPSSIRQSTTKSAKFWGVLLSVCLLFFVGHIWRSYYGSPDRFQAHSRVNMTDSPTEELFVAVMLVILVIFIGLSYGFSYAKQAKKGTIAPNLPWDMVLFCLIGSIALSSSFFALYWPWPYLTGEAQSRLISLSPYTFPVASGLASALSVIVAYRRGTKVHPLPEHSVTLRVSGPREAIDVSYKVSLRGRISQSKRLIALLPWEWKVPVHKGTFVSLQADPQRLSAKQSEPVHVQLLVDEKVVRENWAAGRVVECHLVV